VEHGEDSGAAFGFLVIVLIIVALIYFAPKISKHLEERNRVLINRVKDNLSRARKALETDIESETTIFFSIDLLETRRSNGVESLQVISGSGNVFGDKKGLHYISSLRRISWEWEKILKVVVNTQGFGKIKVVLPVTNRQRNSGFQFNGPLELVPIVQNGLIELVTMMSENQASTKKKSSSNRRNKKVTYNITQNIQDSVVENNISINELDD